MSLRTFSRLALLTLASAIGLAAAPGLAQSSSPAAAPPTKLRIGVADVEPLVIKANDRVYDGLAVQLWHSIAERADLTYDFVNVPRERAQGMLNDGELDCYLTATPSTGSGDTTTHSPIYFSSNLAVAYRGGNDYVAILKAFFQPAFYKTVAALSVLLLVIGTIMYFVERKANEEEFGGKPIEGIGAGFWWAGVTLTTIGYGDKAPVSFFGRVVAMLWMLVGLGVSATLTAAIVSLVDTSGSSVQVPRDLREGATVIAAGHELTAFLDRSAVDYAEVETLQAAMDQLAAEEVDYVVANEMELDHYARENGGDFEVKSSRIEPHYFAVGLRPGLPQADTISVLVREVTMSAAWPKWLREYVPR